MSEQVGLRGCGFCGSLDVEVWNACLAGRYVVCNNCKCLGPNKPTVSEAIAAWNKRVSDGELDEESQQTIRGLCKMLDQAVAQNQRLMRGNECRRLT